MLPKQIYGKLAKTMTLIELIKHLARYLPLKTSDFTWNMQILCETPLRLLWYHFSYTHKVSQLGLSVFNNTMEEIDKVQYKAALAIRGAWWRSNHCSKIFEELEWESLSNRRMSRCLLIMYKMVNNQTQEYLTLKPLSVARAPIANPWKI